MTRPRGGMAKGKEEEGGGRKGRRKEGVGRGCVVTRRAGRAFAKDSRKDERERRRRREEGRTANGATDVGVR